MTFDLFCYRFVAVLVCGRYGLWPFWMYTASWTFAFTTWDRGTGCRTLLSTASIGPALTDIIRLKKN